MSEPRRRAATVMTATRADQAAGTSAEPSVQEGREQDKRDGAGHERARMQGFELGSIFGAEYHTSNATVSAVTHSERWMIANERSCTRQRCRGGPASTSRVTSVTGRVLRVSYRPGLRAQGVGPKGTASAPRARPRVRATRPRVLRPWASGSCLVFDRYILAGRPRKVNRFGPTTLPF